MKYSRDFFIYFLSVKEIVLRKKNMQGVCKENKKDLLQCMAFPLSFCQPNFNPKDSVISFMCTSMTFPLKAFNEIWHTFGIAELALHVFKII